MNDELLATSTLKMYPEYFIYNSNADLINECSIAEYFHISHTF